MNTARREVRKALPGEAAALSTLAQRSKAHWGYSPEFMRACQAELTYNCQEIVDYPFYVLHSGARLIGFYALRPRSAAQVELEALFVEPEFIGTGCGRALIAHAKTTAAALGFRELIVQGDPNAVAFYEAAGGTPIGSRESASVCGQIPAAVLHSAARCRPFPARNCLPKGVTKPSASLRRTIWRCGRADC